MIRLLIISFILFSCSNIQEKKELEEMPSAKPFNSLQDKINNTKNGVVRWNGDYTGDIIIPSGISVIIRGTLYGHVEMYGGSISGHVVTISGYNEAISVREGANTINCDLDTYSSAIVTYGGKTTFTGNINAQIDYGIRNASGELYGNGTVYSEYNSALHNSGGDSYTEFTGTLKSNGLFGFEMSGGNAKLKYVNIITTTPNQVEGSGISKYGGNLLQLDNVRITCSGAYSIEKQGVSNGGVIEILSTCYVNKPVAPGLNIINSEKIIPQ